MLLLGVADPAQANPWITPKTNRVPEPGGLALVGVALAALWAFKRRK